MVSVLWCEGQAFGIGVTLTVLRCEVLVGTGFLKIPVAAPSLDEAAVEFMFVQEFCGFVVCDRLLRGGREASRVASECRTRSRSNYFSLLVAVFVAIRTAAVECCEQRTEKLTSRPAAMKVGGGYWTRSDHCHRLCLDRHLI